MWPGTRPYDRAVYTAAQRSAIRDGLVADARADVRITAAALVGSAAAGREDQWSDIDFAVRLAGDEEQMEIADDWTARMYADNGAVHHLDIWSGATLFRVFLLSTSLQVDVSFWRLEDFAASSSSFRLLFGESNEPVTPPVTSPDALIGMGWLYALHARSSIARGRRWQAVYMLNGLRDQVISLVCLRHGLPTHEGRGVDDLPDDVTERLAGTLVHTLERGELCRAFAGATRLLLDETELVDPALSARLTGPANELVRTSRG